MYFRYFVIISPLKRRDLSFEQTWIPRMLYAKFGWNWPSSSVVLEKKIFLISSMYVRFFEIFPLGKGRALQLNKLESPSPKDALYQVWLTLAQWFWRKDEKCEKFTTTTTSDNGQILIRKANSNLRLRWAKYVG